MLAMLLGMLQISLVTLLISLFNFMMLGLQNMTTQYAYAMQGFMLVFMILIFLFEASWGEG